MSSHSSLTPMSSFTMTRVRSSTARRISATTGISSSRAAPSSVRCRCRIARSGSRSMGASVSLLHAGVQHLGDSRNFAGSEITKLRVGARAVGGAGAVVLTSAASRHLPITASTRASSTSSSLLRSMSTRRSPTVSRAFCLMSSSVHADVSAEPRTTGSNAVPSRLQNPIFSRHLRRAAQFPDAAMQAAITCSGICCSWPGSRCCARC
jgi:hypothetical protein